MEKNVQNGKLHRLKLEALGRKYEVLRFVAPGIEEKISASLRQNGQLNPITVVEEEKVQQVLDGFKRLRAAEQIGLETLEVRNAAVGTGKAIILRLNLDRKGLDPVEEGLLLAAMHREDGLAQNVIAAQVGRHKSWVCRRIAMVERLTPEVVENLRLGLITPSQGRALALLPRGNQKDVLEELVTSGLSSRESEQLVKALNGTGIYDQSQIKAEIEKIWDERRNGNEPKEKPEKTPISRMLWLMKLKCLDVVGYLDAHSEWRPEQAAAAEEARVAAQTASLKLGGRFEKEP